MDLYDLNKKHLCMCVLLRILSNTKDFFYMYVYKKWQYMASKLELTLPFPLHSEWDPQPLPQLSPTRLQSSAEC